MPLIKSGSKQAVSKNIRTEMEHGKPQKQAIAIAMDIRRKAKARKMAEGGVVSEDVEMDAHEPQTGDEEGLDNGHSNSDYKDENFLSDDHDLPMSGSPEDRMKKRVKKLIG